MPIDRGCVGPVRFHGDDLETVGLDKTAADRGTRPVEFGRAVARLTEQHHAAVREAVEHRAERRIVEGGKGLRRIGDHLRKAPPARLSQNVRRRGAATVLRPALFAYERNEGDGAQVLGFEGGSAGLHKLTERLAPRVLANRNDKPAAERQLRLQALGDLRSSGRDDNGVKGRRLGPALRAVARTQFDVVISQFRNRRRACSTRDA